MTGASAGTERKTILIVDGDPTIRSVLNKILSAEGYDVLEAEHGGVADKILATHHVDLLLTTIKMEPMNGDELLENIRSRGSDLPVIILTAYVTVAMILKCEKMGIFDFMKKPFKIDAMRMAVKYALAYSEGTSSSPAAGTPELIEALQYKCHHMRNLLREKDAEDLRQIGD
jgi:two-component system response regulator AtoC